MRAFTGIWTEGMRPQMLVVRTNVNSVSRNGVNFRPSVPIVSMTMLSSMNPTVDSATFWMPVGTRACFRPPRNITMKEMKAEIHMRMTTLLTANGPLPQIVGHSTTWEMGGNSNPMITRGQPPCQPWA